MSETQLPDQAKRVICLQNWLFRDSAFALVRESLRDRPEPNGKVHSPVNVLRQRRGTAVLQTASKPPHARWTQSQSALTTAASAPTSPQPR